MMGIQSLSMIFPLGRRHSGRGVFPILETIIVGGSFCYTPGSTNIAMGKNPSFQDVFPIQNMVVFQPARLVYQSARG